MAKRKSRQAAPPAPKRQRRKSIIDFLAERGHLAGYQAEAARQLAYEAERAYSDSAAPSMAGRWGEPSRGKQPMNRPGLPKGLNTTRDYRAALDAMGPSLDNVAVAVAVEDTTLGDLESAMGWPRKAGLVVLRIALDRLARHYRLA